MNIVKIQPKSNNNPKKNKILAVIANIFLKVYFFSGGLTSADTLFDFKFALSTDWSKPFIYGRKSVKNKFKVKIHPLTMSSGVTISRLYHEK